nr:sodium- and chloride-dependent transporter XTRP3-like isoform X2 [Ciona intestinalis]XP_009858932.1 sodium- and chloride-dependent transporter XTRP3-like isoform X1 [Ciona intestinalis]|eukprot:XP_002126250.1 sodium- and chloride-dependent transporter XTRP3-like isoform X2 [Ciona intestinalis]
MVKHDLEEQRCMVSSDKDSSELQVLNDKETGVIESGSKESSKDKTRQSWNNKTEYILTSLGNAVGLGNIWRFPYKCHKHGGGAFLIPYAIMLLVVGYPLLLMEYSMGQRAKKGAIGVWSRVSPYTTGIGIASLVVCLVLGLYYNVILSLAFFYTANSFRFPLPWESCPVTYSGINMTATIVQECADSSPTSYFWFRETLDVPVTIDQGGELNWWVVAASFVAWFALFIGLVRGTSSTGKVMYFAVFFPYIVLTAFAIRTILLDGAAAGIAYLFRPDIEKLKNPAAWLDALTQIFFSIGLGQGTYIAFASYTTTHNNCIFDTIFVATVNSFTSLFVALIVFGVMGFKAVANSKLCLARNEVTLQRMNATLNGTLTNDNVNMTTLNSAFNGTFGNGTDLLQDCSPAKELGSIPGGTGLAFISFCDAILKFPGSNFWSVLFFFMIVNIGLGSVLGNFTGIVSLIRDLGCKISKAKLALLLCIVMFIIGLTLTTKKGIYLVEIFDDVYVGTGLLYIVLCETFAVAFLYGIKRLGNDIHFMTGQRLNIYWKTCMQFLCPILLLGCFGTIVVSYIIKSPIYHAWDGTGIVKMTYPAWVSALVAILLVLTTLSVPLVALLHRLRVYDFSKFAE